MSKLVSILCLFAVSFYASSAFAENSAKLTNQDALIIAIKDIVQRKEGFPGYARITFEASEENKATITFNDAPIEEIIDGRKYVRVGGDRVIVIDMLSGKIIERLALP